MQNAADPLGGYLPQLGGCQMGLKLPRDPQQITSGPAAVDGLELRWRADVNCEGGSVHVTARARLKLECCGLNSTMVLREIKIKCARPRTLIHIHWNLA